MTKNISDIKVNDDYKKIIQGKQIKRYELKDKELYVNYIPEQLDRPRPQYIFETEEKIISKFVGKNLEFVLDTEKRYVINTACVLFLKEGYDYSLKYSKLINFYFKNIYTDYRDVFPTMKSGDIEQIPILKIDFNKPQQKLQHDSIVNCVTQLLAAKQKQAQTKEGRDKEFLANQCNALDTQIDNLVYELYGLTNDEISIVEGG
jgi:TaqI-like C-terminal specificity domain